MEFSHRPVMAQACIDALAIRPQGVYLDGTAGGGGHSLLIAQKLEDGGTLVCLDRDREALSAAKERLKEYEGRVVFAHGNFSEAPDILRRLGFNRVDGALFDLGTSSYQLDNESRGFSYSKDAPLDMRMDQTQAFSASNIINEYDRERLQRVIGEYGEERYAGRIASAICRERERAPLTTTGQLTQVILAAIPPKARREKQHPAKRTFQAIRIEVNGELDAVRLGVGGMLDCLAAGGRLAVISFHSLEDRIVKRLFREAATGCICPKEFPVCVCGRTPKMKEVFRGGLTPSEEEIRENPRARSARLRAAEKL